MAPCSLGQLGTVFYLPLQRNLVPFICLSYLPCVSLLREAGIHLPECIGMGIKKPELFQTVPVNMEPFDHPKTYHRREDYWGVYFNTLSSS